MQELPEIGKISSDVFEEIIRPHLGRPSEAIIVGPRHGVDVGVVKIGSGEVMVLTTDPFFVVPQYGWDRAAWFAVHILASDAATSGLPPRYMTIDLNLPRAISREEFEAMWLAVHRACEDLGIAVVTGHTGRYDGCEYPMIGGATAICLGPEDGYVTPTMAQIGDQILITKGAAIEAAGLFAVTFPERIARAYGQEFAESVQDLFWQMSVVQDALTAASIGVRERGVTAMHDATECGVWGGLVELAQASQVGLIVEKDAVIVRDDVARICDLFQIDPYIAISEGSLVLTVRPHRTDAVLTALTDRGIPVSRVGEIVPAEKGVRLLENGSERPLDHPRVDPFWGAFGRALIHNAEPRP